MALRLAHLIGGDDGAARRLAAVHRPTGLEAGPAGEVQGELAVVVRRGALRVAQPDSIDDLAVAPSPVGRLADLDPDLAAGRDVPAAHRQGVEVVKVRGGRHRDLGARQQRSIGIEVEFGPSGQRRLEEAIRLTEIGAGDQQARLGAGLAVHGPARRAEPGEGLHLGAERAVVGHGDGLGAGVPARVHRRCGSAPVEPHEPRRVAVEGPAVDLHRLTVDQVVPRCDGDGGKGTEPTVTAEPDTCRRHLLQRPGVGCRRQHTSAHHPAVDGPRPAEVDQAVDGSRGREPAVTVGVGETGRAGVAVLPALEPGRALGDLDRHHAGEADEAGAGHGHRLAVPEPLARRDREGRRRCQRPVRVERQRCPGQQRLLVEVGADPEHAGVRLPAVHRAPRQLQDRSHPELAVQVSVLQPTRTRSTGRNRARSQHRSGTAPGAEARYRHSPCPSRAAADRRRGRSRARRSTWVTPLDLPQPRPSMAASRPRHRSMPTVRPGHIGGCAVPVSYQSPKGCEPAGRPAR